MSGPCPRPDCGGETHTDGWGAPIRCPQQGTSASAVTEPTQLTYEQILPMAEAIHRRESAVLAGAHIIVPPFPDCPTCGQQPTELAVRNDHPAHFLEDRVGFGFRPCGHTFTADGEDLYNAYNQARQGVS